MRALLEAWDARLTGEVRCGRARSYAASTRSQGLRYSGGVGGGLTPAAAQRDLERRSRALADTPVTFTADGHAWRLRPSQLGISVNWGAAVVTALREGN